MSLEHRTVNITQAAIFFSRLLEGDAARTVTCDASVMPVVTGQVDPAALDDLVKLCVRLDRIDHAADDTDTAAARASAPESPGREALEKRSSARPSTSCPARAGWPASCAPGSWAPG